MLRVHNSVKGYQCPLSFFPVQCGNINVTNYNLEQPGSFSRVYMYKEKVEFSCDEGHELPEGSPNGSIECLANGNWSDEPSCEPGNSIQSLYFILLYHWLVVLTSWKYQNGDCAILLPCASYITLNSGSLSQYLVLNFAFHICGYVGAERFDSSNGSLLRNSGIK